MRKTLERAHEDLEVIMQDTRDAMLKYGFTDEAGLRVLNTTFENYVPLRGRDAMGVMDAEGNVAGSDRTIPHVPRQMDPHHLLDTRAGRGTEATDILASILHDNANIHIMGQKNLALQKLHEFVLQNPDPTTYKIMETGDGVSARNENTVAVMIDGEAQHIVFKDADIAASLRGLLPDQMPKLIKDIKKGAIWATWIHSELSSVRVHHPRSRWDADKLTSVYRSDVREYASGLCSRSNGGVWRG